MALPEWPPQARPKLPPEMWSWWQAFKSFMNNQMSTQRAFTVDTSGKGIVLTNAAGDVTKRIRLNDLGDGLIIEDV